jgi:2-phosphosulfolactate phosphatase
MPIVTIDCFTDALPAYPRDAVVVGVDVIRATTTAITAVAAGRRCHVVPSLEEAMRLRELLDEPLLVGELGGNMPYGFDVNNSPAAIASHPHPERPAILLSSSGTRLLTLAAAQHAATGVACLRNWSAQADAIAASGPGIVVLIGAGTRGEFREEDRLCCAWIGARLVEHGYQASGSTRRVIDEWRDAPADAISTGASARYLRDSGQLADLTFILEHVGDLDSAFEVQGTEVIRATPDATDGDGG